MTSEGDDEDTDTEVEDVVVQELGVDRENVHGAQSFVEDLGVDSLDKVELIMVLEERFGLEISDDEAEKLETVQDVKRYVAGRRHGG
jgi:acyl carrier protein